MGYTHYWKFKKIEENSDIKFENAVNEFKRLYGLMKKFTRKENDKYSGLKGGKVEIFGYDGTGEPILQPCNNLSSVACVSFNGDASKGQDYETFAITPNETGFSFCKTARKSYDFAVCVCLLCFASEFDYFNVSSDGTADDWELPVQWFKDNSTYKILPKRISERFDVSYIKEKSLD